MQFQESEHSANDFVCASNVGKYFPVDVKMSMRIDQQCQRQRQSSKGKKNNTF